MMVDDGGPAFPTSRGDKESGTTIRDYFAVKALQGVLASGKVGLSVERETFKLYADGAYKLADAMIERRKNL